ncbi:hypothetical protein [Nitrospira moscoviensis]|uniref:Uncharacterized protein n=1 Tax=Nitrospira moscoviensis TaxID=42253 RepID=A0A0K2G839_NITMO|nr:hypothetical protein [Nitrospira moscoviensis]ALA57019.1 hypothetical protein NITMOv2_0583 [Nitrospira moscoviensis]
MPADPPCVLSADETALLADDQFFRKKAAIGAKIRGMLEATEQALKQEVAAARLLAPPGFDMRNRQLVKGEHLEDFPYQYLDCPKHFDGVEKFTFRTLVWWGHHVACAMLLEGAGLRQYKKHIVERFHQLAGRELELSLAPTLWEWKRGEGYTLPITHDRKAQIAAVLAERSFVKIIRCLPLTDPRLQGGQLPQFSRDTFRALLPIVAA